MSFDPLSLLVSMVVSSAGFVAFVYGKRQGRAPQIITGLALMIFPYFVASPLLTLVIGAALGGAMALVIRFGW